MSPSQTPESGVEHASRHSTRNPRRRQRQSDGDSLKTTAPRRKRSKLSDDTFAVKQTTEVEVLMNGSANGTHSQTISMSGPMDNGSELPVRGKRSSIKRTLKGDGAAVLTQNSIYTVKQLPSTPRELQRDGIEYRGSLAEGDTHLALAVTRQHALVWDYTAHTHVNNARVFDVPFTVKETDSLPFGALVSNGTSTDIGLVLVMATAPWSVVYYQSIERAASIGLFQERKTGVDGVLSGLFAGETVVDVTSAEHAGFVLMLSSGRIVQLTLRDGQGKPKVSSNILRANESNASSIFGSIKGLLTANWKRATAVRTRALNTRGHMQAVALTDRAEILLWDLDWSSRQEYKGSIDVREVFLEELKKVAPPESQGSADSMTILDFAISEDSSQARGDEVTTLAAAQPLDLWVLVASGHAGVQQYTLFEMSLSGDTISWVRSIALDSYQGHPYDKKTAKPRIILPKPGHTGYVAFGDAMVLFSTIDTVEDGPERQLHDESYVAPLPFQDAVFLRSDKDVAVLGAASEESRNHKDASCIAFLRGAGLVRFNAVDPAGDVERSTLSAKSKIEQAVFYGLLQDNVLDFSRDMVDQYPPDEVEAAALTISNEILCSRTPLIPIPSTAMESHLAFRAQALRALVTHLAQSYPVLSKSTMWQLLWDAERLAAGQEMFKAFEEPKVASGRGSRGLYETCSYACSKPEFSFFGDATGQDLVYRLFVNGLDHLNVFLPVARELVEQMVHESGRELQEQYVKVIIELVDLWVRTIHTIFTFRADNATNYGMSSVVLADGVLDDANEYTGLPEFWTSSPLMIKAILKIVQASRNFAAEIYEKPQDDSQDSRIAEGVKKMVVDVAKLVQLWCLMYQERINWLSSRESPRQLDEGRRLEQAFVEMRRDQFQGLVPIGQSKLAIQLAEKYRDMHALTELNVGESQWFLECQETAQSPEEKLACVEELQIVLDRIGRYFEKFGDEWANAFFDEAFAGSRAGHMLTEAQEKWGEALTRYLRADKTRAKICWIDDVVSGQDYQHASTALKDAATERESRLWAKKVELSMSKLALMAAEEADGAVPARKETVSKLSRNLEIASLQQRLYDHMSATIMHALDSETEVQVVMDRFATRADSPALRQLLASGLQRIIKHEVLDVEELIDVFTLMDTMVDESEENNLQGSEYICALRVLDAAAPDLDAAHFEMLNALIWKRCYLQDDWHSIISKTRPRGRGKKTRSTPTLNDEIQTTLTQTAAWRTIYILYDTGSGKDQQVRILPPSECLGAACRAEHLSSRFEDDALLHPILQDNRLQDEQLKGLVEDDKLDDWLQTVEHEVVEAWRREAEQLVERHARERGFAEDEQLQPEGHGRRNVLNGRLTNGHGNGANGIKVEDEEDQEEEEEDGAEDVLME
nr:nucleoporin NUP133-like [Quercus suber]POF16449.1 nucleoporin [Quercus suber]